jgi:TP901 family phage tail tape measure protein
MADYLTSAEIRVRAETSAFKKDILKALNTVELSQINTKKSSQALGRITGKVSEFNKSLEASNARVIAFGASAGAIFAVERALSSLISSTIEVEKKLTDINVLLNASSSELQKFGSSLFSIARNTAQSFSTVADAAAEFARQGLGIEETLKRTNAALILTRLSGLDAVKSVEALTATVNSFSNSALDAVSVVNKLATVDAAFAVSSADLANAISRVGSTAQDAGVSLDELISIVTAAQQTTARGGSVIGNSLKTIFTRLQRGKVQGLLESLGVDTSEGQSAISLLQQLATVYDDLSASQKSYVAEQVGGVFQINILKAALGDLGKEYSIYGRALDISLNATDEAIRRNELLNKTVSALSAQAVANLQQAASKIGSIVFEPNAKNLLSGFNDFLENFNNIDTESQGGKFIQGFFKGISNFIAGPGTIIAVAVLTKLFAKLTQFAAGSAKELLGRNEATKQQAALEQSVLSILQKNTEFTSKILTGKLSTVQAEKQLLDYLTAQSNVMREQERLSKVIAGNLGRSGVVVGASGVPTVKTKPSKASGFIPNFASNMAIGQAMENAGAKEHGYKAGKARKTRIYDGAGKSFTSFVNSKEDIVNFRNSAGKRATIVRPPNGFGENTEIAAEGFIPNFALIRGLASKEQRYNYSAQVKKSYQKSLISGSTQPSFLAGRVFEAVSQGDKTLSLTESTVGPDIKKGKYAVAEAKLSGEAAYKDSNFGLGKPKGNRLLLPSSAVESYDKKLAEKRSAEIIRSKEYSHPKLFAIARRMIELDKAGKYERYSANNIPIPLSSGFIPNFAGQKMQSRFREIMAQRAESTTFASRSSKEATKKSGKIPVKDLGNLDYTMIHPQDEGVMPTGEIGILRKDKRTGVQSRYFGKFKTSGLSSSDVAKKANASTLQNDVSNFLLNKANNFASIFNPAAKFSDIGQFSDKGAVMTAVGTVFESAIRKAFNQEAQSKNQAFDFPSPNTQLRNFFGNAPGPYEAKGSNSLPNKESSLDKWVRNNNLFGGFIPNFAAGIITGDAIRGNEYKAVLDYLAKTSKPIKTILGPSGVGKTTLAAKSGGKIARSLKDLDLFDNYILDRASLGFPKDAAVAENLKKIFSKSSEAGSLEVLFGSRNTIKSLRDKRAAEGDKIVSDRPQLPTGSGGVSSFVKGIKGFKSEYPGAKISRMVKKGGSYSLMNVLSSGFVPNFLDVKKASLPLGVRGRTNFGNNSKSNIQLGVGATQDTLAHELFHGAYSRSTFKKASSNPSIGKFISNPGKYAGAGGVISDTLFKGVNRKNLYAALGLNNVQLDFEGKNPSATYSGAKAIDEIVTRIQEKVFRNKGNLDLLSADEKAFVRNLEDQGIIGKKRLSNISRRSKEGSKFRSLVGGRFSSAMSGGMSSGFLPNFADQLRRNVYDWDGTIIPRFSGKPEDYISKLNSLKEKDLLPIGKKLKAGKKKFDILTSRPKFFEGAISQTASRLGLPVNQINFGVKPKEKIAEANKRGSKLVDDDLGLIGQKGYLNARLVNKRLGSGFIPNFAYKLVKNKYRNIREIVDPKTRSYLEYGRGSEAEIGSYLDISSIRSNEKGQGLQLFSRLAKTAKRSGRKIKSQVLVPQVDRLSSVGSGSALDQVVKAAFPQLLYRDKSGAVKNSEMDFIYNLGSGRSVGKKLSGKGAFSLILNEIKKTGVSSEKLIDDIVLGNLAIGPIVDSVAKGFIPNFASRSQMIRDLIKFNLESTPDIKNKNVFGSKTTLFRGITNKTAPVFRQSRNYSTAANAIDYFRDTDINEIAKDHIKEKKLLPFLSASADEDIAKYFARGRREDDLLGEGRVGSKTIKNSRIFSAESINKFIKKYGQKALKELMMENSTWGSFGFGKGIAINFRSFSNKEGFEGTDFAKEVSFLSKGFIPNFARLKLQDSPAFTNFYTDSARPGVLEVGSVQNFGGSRQSSAIKEYLKNKIKELKIREIDAGSTNLPPRLLQKYAKELGVPITGYVGADKFNSLSSRRQNAYGKYTTGKNIFGGRDFRINPKSSSEGFVPNFVPPQVVKGGKFLGKKVLDVAAMAALDGIITGDEIALLAKSMAGYAGPALAEMQAKVKDFFGRKKVKFDKNISPKDLQKVIGVPKPPPGYYDNQKNNLNSGFIPNFAEISQVMALESAMSGEKATFHTKPFPHIRNKSQPTFGSAMADHGGLNKALKDSVSGQKSAGLLSRGFVPNFAESSSDGGGGTAIASVLAGLQGLAFSLIFINQQFKEAGKAIKEGEKALADFSSGVSDQEQSIAKQEKSKKNVSSSLEKAKQGKLENDEIKQAKAKANVGAAEKLRDRFAAKGDTKNANRTQDLITSKLAPVRAAEEKYVQSIERRIKSIDNQIKAEKNSLAANKAEVESRKKALKNERRSRLGGLAFPLGSAAQVLAPQLASLVPQETKTGKGVAAGIEGLGNVAGLAGTGAMFGAMFGPLGIAVGGATGALVGLATELPKVLKIINTQVPELEKAFSKSSESLTKFSDSGQRILQLSEQYETTLQSGDVNASSQLAEIQKNYQQVLMQLTDAQRSSLISALNQGKGQEAYAKILQQLSGETKAAELQLQLRKFQEDGKKSDIAGISDSLAKAFTFEAGLKKEDILKVASGFSRADGNEAGAIKLLNELKDVAPEDVKENLNKIIESFEQSSLSRDLDSASADLFKSFFNIVKAFKDEEKNVAALKASAEKKKQADEREIEIRDKANASLEKITKETEDVINNYNIAASDFIEDVKFASKIRTEKGQSSEKFLSQANLPFAARKQNEKSLLQSSSDARLISIFEEQKKSSEGIAESIGSAIKGLEVKKAGPASSAGADIESGIKKNEFILDLFKNVSSKIRGGDIAGARQGSEQLINKIRESGLITETALVNLQSSVSSEINKTQEVLKNIEKNSQRDLALQVQQLVSQRGLERLIQAQEFGGTNVKGIIDPNRGENKFQGAIDAASMLSNYGYSQKGLRQGNLQGSFDRNRFGIETRGRWDREIRGGETNALLDFYSSLTGAVGEPVISAESGDFKTLVQGVSDQIKISLEKLKETSKGVIDPAVFERVEKTVAGLGGVEKIAEQKVLKDLGAVDGAKSLEATLKSYESKAFEGLAPELKEAYKKSTDEVAKATLLLNASTIDSTQKQTESLVSAMQQVGTSVGSIIGSQPDAIASALAAVLEKGRAEIEKTKAVDKVKGLDREYSEISEQIRANLQEIESARSSIQTSESLQQNVIKNTGFSKQDLEDQKKIEEAKSRVSKFEAVSKIEKDAANRFPVDKKRNDEDKKFLAAASRYSSIPSLLKEEGELINSFISQKEAENVGLNEKALSLQEKKGEASAESKTAVEKFNKAAQNAATSRNVLYPQPPGPPPPAEKVSTTRLGTLPTSKLEEIRSSFLDLKGSEGGFKPGSTREGYEEALKKAIEDYSRSSNSSNSPASPQPLQSQLSAQQNNQSIVRQDAEQRNIQTSSQENISSRVAEISNSINQMVSLLGSLAPDAVNVQNPANPASVSVTNPIALSINVDGGAASGVQGVGQEIASLIDKKIKEIEPQIIEKAKTASMLAMGVKVPPRQIA